MAYKEGDRLIFRGYSAPNEDPIFEAGQEIVVQSVNEDGGLRCVPANGDGGGDTVYDEEVMHEASADEADDGLPNFDPSTIAVSGSVGNLPAAPASAAGMQIMSDEEARDAVEAAKAIIRRSEEDFIALGKVLAAIKASNAHLRYGYDGKRAFNDFCARELGIEYRHALYLIDIHVAYTPLGVPTDRLVRIGWSKLKDMTKIVTKRNVDHLLGYAETHTRDMLVDYIRDKYLERPDLTGRRQTVRFRLPAPQADYVRGGVAAAKQVFGIHDDDAAIARIIEEWAALKGVTIASSPAPAADAGAAKRGKRAKAEKAPATAKVEKPKAKKEPKMADAAPAPAEATAFDDIEEGMPGFLRDPEAIGGMIMPESAKEVIAAGKARKGEG